MSDEPFVSSVATRLAPLPVQPLAPTAKARSAVTARMAGPGGVYNLGNALGLAGGLWLAVEAAAAQGDASLGGAAQAIMSYLAGSGSAVALTIATLIFFWSGEVYHRAWAADPAPDPTLNRQGDLLSALGALVLGVALALLGHPLLAATAGFLHALGKLGSALHDPGADLRWPRSWPDPFRTLVLLSRLPAIWVAIAALLAAAQAGAPSGALTEPALLLACYALWAKADLMLFRS